MTTMTVADPTALVGFVAFDRNGEELGEIEGVYLGTEEPEWAAVLMGSRFVIIPLVDADIFEDSLNIPFTAAEVAGAPLQQEDLLEDLTEAQEDLLVAYYTSGTTEGGASAAVQEVRDAGSELASTARDQGQEVASTAVEQGQQVASTAREQSSRVAATARQQSQQVLRSTADQAGEVVGTAKQQAGEVAQLASVEARNLLDETRARLEEQTAQGAQTLAENLSRLGDEAMALADGRPQEAPTLERYVRRTGETLLDAADRAYGLSDEVRNKGIGSLLGDVQTFARRRPGVFLLGTAVAGVLAGRAVRNAKEAEAEAAQPTPTAALPRSTNGGRANGRTTTARAGTRAVR